MIHLIPRSSGGKAPDPNWNVLQVFLILILIIFVFVGVFVKTSKSEQSPIHTTQHGK